MAPMAEYDKLEIVTEEVVICKLLTSNDTKVRKKGLSSLKKWFKKIGLKKGIQEDDFNRIWSGLFYYFWMSDKPLVQEEAAEYISGMVHVMDNYQATMFYVRGFFNSIVKQWDRISHYRIDKFLMFVRRFLRQILILLENHEWDIEKLELFSAELYSAIQVLPYSLALHLNEIFNEEVAKISKGKISTDALIALYKGFFECIVNLRPSMQVVNSIQSNIFGGLARQLKLHIKQKALAEDCDNEKNNENAGSDNEGANTVALDPRPGGVDVFLPFIELDETIFVKFMEQHTSKPIPIKAKNIITQLISMFSSITKLRVTVSDTDKLIREMQDNPKKRKRPKQTLSKLIKNSCRRLEEEEEEDETEHDERVLKKLRSLADIIQIPAGKSTFTVVQAKPANISAEKRTSISNEWTVTKTVEKSGTPKKTKLSGSKNDWVVEETPPKGRETSANEISGVSSDDVKSLDEPTTILENEPSLVSVQLETEKTELCEKDEQVTDSEIDDVEKVDSTTSKKPLSVSFSEEPVVSRYEDDSEKDSQNCSTESEIIVPASVVKAHPKLMKEDRDYVVVDFHPKTVDEEVVNQILEKVSNESIPEKELPSTPDSKRTRKPREKKIESSAQSQRKSTRIAGKHIGDGEKVDSTPTKKPRFISFSEEPVVSQKDGQNSDTESEIVVPVSVVETHPELMVDSHSKTNDDKVVSQKPEKVSNELLLETEYPSTPDSKRSRKPREKKIESSAQSLRKSSRIAEKQKKVLFKLEENTYQDVPTYENVLKSNPASPFDSSKLPASSILKPYAVTSPINPFYLANGERKLKRKRKKN